MPNTASPPVEPVEPMLAPRTGLVTNRVGAIMQHVPYYTFKGQARLAQDAGIAPSTVSRLLSGRSAPSYPIVQAIATALERRLGTRLDPREVVSLDGHFPTPSVCTLVGCKGCLPQQAYTPDDTLTPAYAGVLAGQWSETTRARTRSTTQKSQRERASPVQSG